MSGRAARKLGGAHAWRVYARLLGYVRPYRTRIIVGFACGLAYAGANGAMVWAIKGGIREIFNPAELGFGALLAVAAFFPAVAAVRGLTDYLSTYYIRWVGHRVVMDLRNAAFKKVHDLSVDYFTGNRTGETISRVINDPGQVESAVSSVIADLAKQPLTFMAMVVWVFMVDVRLAVVSLFVFPLCVMPVLVMGKRVRRHSRESQERIADVLAILQETVAGARIVKAFGMEAWETRRFAAQTAAFFSRMMRVTRASISVEPVIVLLAATGIALVLLYVRVVRMSIEDFFAFAVALFMMYEPVKKLGKIYVSIQQSAASAERVFELLDTRGTVCDAPAAVALAEPIERIEFDRIGFAYGEQPVLNDITLAIRAGERVAFVGGSGAGKTTLVNLVPRFYDVTAGAVRINGTDIRRLTLSSLRARIGLVTQETFLFNDTVANNIAYGAGDVTPSRIEDAARRAHAHDFVQAMPQGYATIIGERGVRLSGGERQRLAIARAILRNPPILILDEATSALDTESERAVQAALNELMRGRTVLAIAHRLSTIVNCDRIVVLAGGRIVEQGRHDELLALNGVYRRLYDLQFDLKPEAVAAEHP